MRGGNRVTSSNNHSKTPAPKYNNSESISDGDANSTRLSGYPKVRSSWSPSRDDGISGGGAAAAEEEEEDGEAEEDEAEDDSVAPWRISSSENKRMKRPPPPLILVPRGHKKSKCDYE